MTNTISGFQIQNSFVGWMSLIEEWLLATQRFYRLVVNGETAYKYNERGHVSILAGRHGVADGERLASLSGKLQQCLGQAELTCGFILELCNSFVRRSLNG